ncbi:MAG: hypothetical protein A2527_13950 [Candidatus Lambdaproteobacteria bacterium RIFOXYD2_FULL_50_16]|uniref:histidine kinase n=1 Tax=Candidatus Lambdaproteobacteria bacterium RIFOXYD2_FULL_50_16 TaxID=1817772 RepID=A0A1F6G4K4_9PROT|nr:MAG: hypothetical protein A2527_13950 [Candidatus Lambdaproteobacteria bacterium RIFOXYD2_FULL_50_16]
MASFRFPLPGQRRFDLKVDIVLLVLLFLSFIWLAWINQNQKKEKALLAEAHFTDSVQLVQDRLDGELHRLNMLNQLTTAFLNQGIPNEQSWGNFVEGLKLKRFFPHLFGLMFSPKEPGNLRISLVAPQARQQSMLGLDLGPDLLRDALSSMDRNEPILSEIGYLPGMQTKILGFWVIMPHFVLSHSLGWSLAPVDLERFIKDALDNHYEELQLVLYQEGQPIYQTPVQPAISELNASFPLSFGGQIWQVHLKPGSLFYQQHKIILEQRNNVIAWFLGLMSIWALMRTLIYSLSGDGDPGELRQALAEKDRFFSLIAHDLKSPFNSLLTICNLLVHESENLKPAELKTLAKNAYHTASLALTLLHNLLDWAKRQQGSLKPEPGPINLIDLVEPNLQLLGAAAENKGISLNSDLKEDCWVWVDENMVLTVVRNLLSNAIKFTGPGGKIQVTAIDQPGKAIRLCIDDSGVGMDEAQIKGLFKGGWGHSKPGTDGEMGTGLGLYVCREFISANNGHLTATSKLGQGSCFTISLPRADSSGA